jgi:hypothetical protein
MDLMAALMFGALVSTTALCALFLFAIQPIWGIVDVATSEKHSGGAKAVVILLTLLLLGPLMTFLYACFGTPSSALRKTTLTAFAVMMVAGLGAIGMALGVPAANHLWTPSARAHPGAPSHAAEAATPLAFDRLPADLVAPFAALHLVQNDPASWSVCIAQFTGYGPRPDSTIPVVLPSIYPVTHLAVDADGPVYYAITTHEVGRIVPATGRFIEFEPDPAIGKPSWPSAIAYDSERHLLLIAARSQGYSYKPSTGEWKSLPGLKDDDLIALAYSPGEAVLYALRTKPGGGLAMKLVKLSPNGARLRETHLSHPIAVGQYPFPLAQLCCSGKQLIVLVSPQDGHGVNPRTPAQASIYSIDPDSGVCRLVDPSAAVQAESESNER